MCGITGFWSSRLEPRDRLEQRARSMARAVAHRGPDGEGIWIDADAGLALAHRRLAIIDLSDAGAQPMASASGRFLITFNGEIYNYGALRKELVSEGRAPSWRGGSDTEVLLAAIEAWGVEATLLRCDGMFAFALWDKLERRLVLARDRFGEKPLYYGLIRGILIFGSELRALAAAVPLSQADIDPQAVDLLIRTLCIPAPLSIFRGIQKLSPGQWLSISSEDLKAQRLPEPQTWWCARATALAAAARPFVGTETEAVDRLAELVVRSAQSRLISDVPVGAMLSGGVDSTAVCGAAQAASRHPLKTYTIGFDDLAHDESPYAEAVAQALGTDHTTIQIGPDEARAAILDMAGVYDEPFADSSGIVTSLICRALRRSVTVALTGDAGDELFGGYVRYRQGPKLWAGLGRTPMGVRAIAAGVIRVIGSGRVANTAAAIIGARGEQAGRISKALRLIECRSPDELYARVVANWPLEERLARGATPQILADLPGKETLSFTRRMMLADTLGYLHNDVLAKVDRAAMSTSLETRVPLLEPEIFAFAWSLPERFLIQGHRGKMPLRRLAERFVPASLLDRPKQGFSVPLASWLRGPLKEWADDLLSVDRLTAAGLVEVRPIVAAWRAHRTGSADCAHQIWPVLMLEAWRDAWTSLSTPLEEAA